MFSLIITIISIALVAVLALASIYYGGSAVGQGSDSARASQLINEGQQLQGLAAMSTAQGNTVTTVADLVTTGHLSQAVPGWAVDGAAFVRVAVDEDVDVAGIQDSTLSTAACAEVNDRSDAAPAGGYADVAAALADNGQVFFCTDIGGANTVVYRF